MKLKVSIIVWLLLLLYSAVVFELADLVMLCRHRSEVEASLQKPDHEDEEQLILSEKEYQSLLWLKPDKDFVWQDDVYDLVRLVRKGDDYILICKKDHKEKRMLARMKTARRQKKELLKEKQKKLYTATFFSLPQIFRELAGVSKFRYLPYLLKEHIAQFSPPPEQVA